MNAPLKIVVAIIVIVVLLAGAFFVALRLTSAAMFKMPDKGFKLYDSGSKEIVRYEEYGKFIDEGTTNYRYAISSRRALAKAVGEGIYPNTSVYKDPRYKQLLKEGKLAPGHWKSIYTEKPEEAFFIWATANENPGVRQFYTALTLENAGLIEHAIKAYYATIVHFPKTVSFTYWKTPWYPAKVAIDKIHYLTLKYPLLGMKLVGASANVENGFNRSPEDDIYRVNPGRIIKCKPYSLVEKQAKKRLGAVIKQAGFGKINLLQYRDGDWQLMVNDTPFVIKGMVYEPTKIGQSPDEGTLMDWTRADYNNNEIIDGPYEAWVDRNVNDIQDDGERAIGDFALMQKMGVNTIRIYDHKAIANKKILRELYGKYGIMVIMGDLLGTYAVGSGASWYRGTNYSDPEHRERLKARVREMVEAYKDEPYVLMWVLGNETNYGVANNSKRFPRPFYKFVNEVALMIKKMDVNHPVALCNGDTLYLDIFAELCPDIDVLGVNSYRGWQGFGFWHDVKRICGKPVMVTEYGAPAYWKGRTREEAESAQREYLVGSWKDIFYNTAGYGYGNALGGFVFEWTDEWWKAYEPQEHDVHEQWPGSVKGGWIYEEWFGITSQGAGRKSPYLRQIREGYYAYKKMWNPTIEEKLKKMWYNLVLRLAK